MTNSDWDKSSTICTIGQGSVAVRIVRILIRTFRLNKTIDWTTAGLSRTEPGFHGPKIQTSKDQKLSNTSADHGRCKTWSRIFIFWNVYLNVNAMNKTFLIFFFHMTSFRIIVISLSRTTPSSMLTSWKSMASPSFKSAFWASVLVLAWLRFDLRTGVRTRSPAAFFFLTWKRILESNWKMVEKVEFRSLKVARETYHESLIRSIWSSHLP